MDPYRVLGISESATDEEVTAAYRRLARKYHPDLNGGSAEAEAKMKELNSAHEAIRAQREGRAQPNMGQEPPPYGSAAQGGYYTAWTPYGTYRVYRTYRPVRPVRLFPSLLRFILTLMLLSFLFRACALLPFAYMPEGGGTPPTSTANTVPPRGEI